MQPAFSMAPELNSGTITWSYLSNGYGYEKAFSKNSNPCLVTSKSSSGSRYCASDWRQYSPMGIPPLTSWTPWYGPAITAVMYVEMGGVGRNDHRLAWPSAAGPPAAPMLDSTSQSAGASTTNSNGALTSGWSKQANTRWASKGS